MTMLRKADTFLHEDQHNQPGAHPAYFNGEGSKKKNSIPHSGADLENFDRGEMKF